MAIWKMTKKTTAIPMKNKITIYEFLYTKSVFVLYNRGIPIV